MGGGWHLPWAIGGVPDYIVVASMEVCYTDAVSSRTVELDLNLGSKSAPQNLGDTKPPIGHQVLSGTVRPLGSVKTSGYCGISQRKERAIEVD